ncbi:hypothetical protein AGLY_000060, partial [Aphis glycines]
AEMPNADAVLVVWRVQNYGATYAVGVEEKRQSTMVGTMALLLSSVRFNGRARVIVTSAQVTAHRRLADRTVSTTLRQGHRRAAPLSGRPNSAAAAAVAATTAVVCACDRANTIENYQCRPSLSNVIQWWTKPPDGGRVYRYFVLYNFVKFRLFVRLVCCACMCVFVCVQCKQIISSLLLNVFHRFNWFFVHHRPAIVTNFLQFQMKWLGAGNVPVSSTNNTVLNNSGNHLQEHQQQLNESESSGDNVLRQTVQEEPIVNYVFDCASGESQEYGLQSAPLPSKLPQPRWPATSEDCFLEQMQEKWKYFSAKMSQPPPQISEVPNVQYQLQPILVKSGEGGAEQYVYGAPPGLHPYQQHMADLANSSMAHNSAHAIMSTQQQHTMDLHMRNGETIQTYGDNCQ